MLFALGLFGALLFALGFPAHAQQLVKAPKLGCYMLGAAGLGTREEAFRQGLKDLGYVEGQNIFIEWRFAAGQADQDKTIVDELVRLNVDIIVTDGNRSTSAAKNATRTIPIVMAVSGDSLGAGLVKTLARPGGNITGLTLLSPELSGKRLEILKETMPKISHVAVLFNPSNPGATLYLNEVQVAAKSLGLQLQTLKASSPTELASALDLQRPLRFWHMLIESNTFRPMFKLWSPMSVGAWALLIFGIFSLLSFLGALVEDNRLAWPAGRRFRPPGMLSKVIAVIGGLVGFYVAGYTGVLLAVTNRPIWSDTPLLGMLFVVSAASISAALMILLAQRSRWTMPGLVALHRMDAWVVALEFIVLIGVMISLGPVFRAWLSAWGLLLFLGVIVVGMLMPLALYWRKEWLGDRNLTTAAAW